MIFVQQDCSLIMEKAWEISKIMRDPFGRRSKHKICIGQLIPSFEAGRFGRKAKSWPWTKRIVGLILQKTKLKSEKNSKYRRLTRIAQFVQEFYETFVVCSGKSDLKLYQMFLLVPFAIFLMFWNSSCSFISDTWPGGLWAFLNGRQWFLRKWGVWAPGNFLSQKSLANTSTI